MLPYAALLPRLGVLALPGEQLLVARGLAKQPLPPVLLVVGERFGMLVGGDLAPALHEALQAGGVLLAEHEPGSRELLEHHLREDGFTVFGAAWTSRALDLAERVSPDLVIAGEADLCRRLRAGEPGRTWDRNVPVSNYRKDPTPR